MLTKVILDGPLGKAFGREWDLAVCTPNDALSMVEANKPGVFSWIRRNAAKYANYRVTITDKKGKRIKVDSDTYGLQRSQPAMIRFSPLTTGAGAAARIVVGVVLLVVSYFFPPLATYLVPAAIGLIVGGMIELLSPRPKKADKGTSDDGVTSYYFNGPVNTTQQGIPVPLVYGRCLVGSQSVSASITIDQLMG